MFSPAGKKVVVSGEAQGIGRAISKIFAEQGALVSPWDIDREALEDLQEEYSELASQFLPLPCDVTSGTEAGENAKRLAEARNQVDIVINNAGINVVKSLGELGIEEWNRVITTNLQSVYLLTHYLLPLMPRGASIINIASTRALMSEPSTEAHSASKGGILSLTHALAISLAPRRIRVNAISPGWIETSNWKKRSIRKEPVLRDINHLQHPAGRVSKPEDIAYACLFLSSEEASFITGVNLVIDGGITVKDDLRKVKEGTVLEIIDISLPIEPHMPSYKGQPNKKAIIERVRSIEEGANETRIALESHTGTHIDAPLHMLKEGKSIDQIPLRNFFGPALLIEIRGKEVIGKEELFPWRSCILKDHFLLIKTDNSFQDLSRENYVYLTQEGAQFLAEKEIKGVGIDSLGIERNQPGHPTHKILLSKGILIIEGLNLSKVECGMYFLSAFPLNIKGCDGAPARAVLWRF